MSDRPIVAIVHPGAMGSSVGAVLRGRARVVFAGAGRSAATRERARADGIEDVGDETRLAAEADVVISVCPPHAAETVAARFAELGFHGRYVDANAVAPATARRIAARMEAAGAHFVDGGIVGPPARRPGTTRLWLSGAEAPALAALFEGSVLEATVLDDRPGSASALKMAFAAWSKGTTALLAAIRAFAEAEGVSDALQEQWRLVLPELAEHGDARIAATLPKAWRFVGEMEEIADSFAARELPDGFHRAAAEIYAAIATAQALEAGSVTVTLDALARSGTRRDAD